MPATKKPVAKRPAVKKPVKPPSPPKNQAIEEEFVDDEERQTLILEDEKYFVDELSEEAQDLIKLLQYINIEVEETKLKELILEE